MATLKSLPPPPALPEGVINSSAPSSTSSRILTNKVQNAISLNTTTPSFSSALTALSTLQTPNKIDARSIRTAIEQDALYQAKCLEDEMRRLVGVVRDMRAGIKIVVSIAEGVKDSVREVVPNDNKQFTNQFDEERKLAELLASAFQERNEASLRYDTLQEFMQKFDLSENDSSLLDNYNFEGVLDPSVGTITNDKRKQSMKDGIAFLDALNRVTTIRKELSSSFEFSSSINLTGDDHITDPSSTKLGPASAMRMVENLTSKQDRAFERLYHFLHSRLDLSQASVANVPTSSSAAPQTVVKIQDGMDETLLHPFIRKSIVVLHQIPAYYKHTLELIATSRRAEVTRKFLLALTSGYDGMAPIEMKAHDPVNYVGDMLAFVFRTMSVESELARGLFIDDDKAEKDFYDGGSGMRASDVLNDIVSGIARPLKSRLSQVTNSLAKRSGEDIDGNVGGIHDEEASTARIRLASLYSICGLLMFYKSAMNKAAKKIEVSSGRDDERMDISSSKNPLVACLMDCIDETARAYVLSLKVHIATFDSLTSSSRESQASVAYEVITRLCDVRTASPGYGIQSDDLAEDISNMLSIEFLFDTIIDAILPSSNNLEDAVKMKLTLSATQKIGLSEECYSKWEPIISNNVQTLIEAQISSDTKDVLDECDLAAIKDAIESMKAIHMEGMVASSQTGLSQEKVEKAVKVFYASLFDPPIPSYSTIKDPVLRKYSRNGVAQNIAQVYQQIYELVKSDGGGYEDTSFLTYDPSQVKSMLSA